jgi:stage V sporulation protein SpoVS
MGRGTYNGGSTIVGWFVNVGSGRKVDLDKLPKTLGRAKKKAATKAGIVKRAHKAVAVERRLVQRAVMAALSPDEREKVRVAQEERAAKRMANVIVERRRLGPRRP